MSNIQSTRAEGEQVAVLYSESQRVPVWWWILGALFVALMAWQGQMGRDWVWGAIFGVVTAIAIAWSLWALGGNKVVVAHKADGVWLYTNKSQLPAEVVSRTLAIPASAKRAAMGRQLDPAAYVVHKAWIPTMAMLVLDDPDDPTPYWLISTRNPQGLLEALGRPIY